MAKLSSRSSRVPPSTVEFTEPSGTDGLTVGPNNPKTSLSSRDCGPGQVLCNEDRLSDYSESSLSITSPVISDGDNNRLAPDLDESETESDEDWDEEPKGDPNQGQNLQFQLQAAVAGLSHLFYFLKTTLADQKSSSTKRGQQGRYG